MRPVEDTYEYQGKRLSAKELSIISGINETTIRNRIKRNKISALEAISKPARKYKRNRKTSRAITLYRKRKLNIKRRSKSKGIKKLIGIYHEVMGIFFTKEHRQRCYQQLKKDFEELQQHLKVA